MDNYQSTSYFYRIKRKIESPASLDKFAKEAEYGMHQDTEYLILSDLGLKEMPSLVYNLPKLKSLNLARNKIFKLSGKPLLELKTILLSYNNFEKFPNKWFDSCPSLENIIMNNNKFEIDEALIDKVRDDICTKFSVYRPNEIGDSSGRFVYNLSNGVHG